MSTRTSIVVAAVVAFGLASAPLGAQGRGNGRGQGAQKNAGKSHQAAKGDDRDAVVFDREGHVRVIREYGNSGSLPPGLAKREALPPGLRKQIRERGTLPPGLQKRLVPVPTSLASRLPAIPRYERRYFAGDDLLVVDTRTNRVVAYVPDVWR